MDEAAGLLNKDELKAIAKDAKCTGTNKAELITQLRKASKTQGSLQFSGGQLKLNFDCRGNYMNRAKQAVLKILEQTGKYILSMVGINYRALMR
jgi:Fanconi-associated nuclease 1